MRELCRRGTALCTCRMRLVVTARGLLPCELCFFFVMWGLIILLVPTRGLRLAYAVTVGAYAGRS